MYRVCHFGNVQHYFISTFYNHYYISFYFISINSNCFEMTDIALEFLFSVIHVLISVYVLVKFIYIYIYIYMYVYMYICTYF